MPPGFGKLGLELGTVCDLPAANVADQQRDGGPADRLGRDAADIAIHVLGHQRRGQATPVLQAGRDDGGRQTGGHAVLQTEHDHRKPERVGIGSGNERKENLFRQHGGAEEQRELEGEA